MKNLFSNEVAAASLSDNGSVKAAEMSKAATAGSAAKPKSSRGKKMSPVYAVLKAARKQFGMQIKSAQNLKTKISCIEENIPRYYGDNLHFWADLKDEAADLMDSVRFNKACEEWGLEPKNVAQHVIFEGKSVKRKVFNVGLKEAVGEMAKAFDQPLYQDEKNTLEVKNKQTA